MSSFFAPIEIAIKWCQFLYMLVAQAGAGGTYEKSQLIPEDKGKKKEIIGNCFKKSVNMIIQLSLKSIIEIFRSIKLSICNS